MPSPRSKFASGCDHRRQIREHVLVHHHGDRTILDRSTGDEEPEVHVVERGACGLQLGETVCSQPAERLVDPVADHERAVAVDAVGARCRNDRHLFEQRMSASARSLRTTSKHATEVRRIAVLELDISLRSVFGIALRIAVVLADGTVVHDLRIHERGLAHGHGSIQIQELGAQDGAVHHDTEELGREHAGIQDAASNAFRS